MKSKNKSKDYLSSYLMVAPPIVGFLIFGFAPLVISLCLRFTELHSYHFADAIFIGIRNFKEVFQDPLFGRAVGNTLYACLSIFVQMALGMFIASILTAKGIHGKKFFRSLFFVPYVCSIVSASIMWKWMFNSEFGIINGIISALGGKKISFLFEEAWFMPIMIIMISWSGTGYYIILCQAALTGVNQSTLEAAAIDGAGAVRKFFNVTLPSISPTIFYLLVMGVIGGLQQFTWFQVVCSGYGGGVNFGPNNAGITIVFYLYNLAFDEIFIEGMGKASAVAFILFIGIVLLTAVNFRLSKKWVHYEDA